MAIVAWQRRDFLLINTIRKLQMNYPFKFTCIGG